MTDLRTAAHQALAWLGPDAPECCGCQEEWQQAIDVLRVALSEPEPRLTDEVIATLWHQNGGFHHHFARAIERWLKGNP